MFDFCYFLFKQSSLSCPDFYVGAYARLGLRKEAEVGGGGGGQELYLLCSLVIFDSKVNLLSPCVHVIV